MAPIPDTSIVGRLKANCPIEWTAYADHDFVRQLAEGTLPEESFRHYLIQDYLFLIHFSRAYALAVYKSDRLEDMRIAAETVNALLNTEMKLHLDYCSGWGLTETDIVATPESRSNMAYTRYVLEAGNSGDLLDLLVALSPCSCGYGEIGHRLLNDPSTKLECNPYRDWIELYGGAEFQDVTKKAVEQIDSVTAWRIGENPEASGRWDSLCEVFRTATLLEAGFWQMGLERS